MTDGGDRPIPGDPAGAPAPSVDRAASSDLLTPSGVLGSRTWIRRSAHAAVLGVALAALAFQQSPANESVRANAAFWTLESTGSELPAALAVVLLTYVIEGATSLLIAVGFALPGGAISRRIARFRRRLNLPSSADAREQASSIPSRFVDTGITLGLGPGLVVVRRHFQEPARTFAADLRTIVGYCTIGAVVSGLIAYVVVGGARHADGVGLGTPAEHFVRWAADWRLWTVLLGGGYLIHWLITSMRARVKKAAR